MPKQLRCRDIGIHCDFEAHGKMEDEALQQAAAHARSVHNITDVPPDLIAKARAAIRNV